jgi:CO dehydrogenase maturation factor
MKLGESLVESSGFDLIAMGRPEGAGCYCYANNVLKAVIAELAGQYPYVLLDNEAGLENLSRRIAPKVDMMALVSDASNAGLETLVRLYDLATEMEIGYASLALVKKKKKNDSYLDKIEAIKKYAKADFVCGLPEDGEIAEFAENGRSLLELPENNPVNAKVNEFIRSLHQI